VGEPEGFGVGQAAQTALGARIFYVRPHGPNEITRCAASTYASAGLDFR